MPCLICGNPKTVRSHLVPRSLALEVRGKDKTLSLLSRTPGNRMFPVSTNGTDLRL